MQVTQAQQGTTTTQPIHPAPGSLNKGCAYLWLKWAMEDMNSASLLHALHGKRKRKPSPESDAIWDGYWALKCKADEYIEGLRTRGGLLFFGQPAAIEVAAALRKADA